MNFRFSGAKKITLAISVGLLVGCSEKNESKEKVAPGPDAVEKKKASTSPNRNYLTEDAKGVYRLVLGPTGAVVLLEEPCGALRNYFRAQVFAYQGDSPSPSAHKSGCYRQDQLKDDSELVSVIESDGVSKGPLMVDVDWRETFSPAHFFLLTDNDPRNTPPKIEAIGTAVDRTDPKFFEYDHIGITRQPCPVQSGWLLARRVVRFPAQSPELCWRGVGENVEVKEFDYDKKPLTLQEEKIVIKKSAFFEVASIYTTPLKYDWR